MIADVVFPCVMVACGDNLEQLISTSLSTASAHWTYLMAGLVYLLDNQDETGP